VVISKGKIVAENGELKIQPRRHRYAETTYNSIHLNRDFKSHDFEVKIYSSNSEAKVRVIDQVTNLLTREAILSLPIENGQIKMLPDKDIVKVSAIERLHEPGKTFTGFIRGLGLKKGAIATSTAWDSSDLIVAGANEADMALAVNRLHQLGGGVVVCLNGKVMAEIAMPVGGMISTETMETIAGKLDGIQQAANEFGCVSADIRTTISVLTTGAIPYLRICESGLFNLRLNSLVDLVVRDQ
jgi:adenine deaminase